MRSYLDFEKPVADLQGKVQELRSLGDAGDAVAIGEEVAKLEAKAAQALAEIYARLTPWQKTQVARHPDRPHTSDYLKHLIDDFTPLAGDRSFGEDHAIVAGLGFFRGRRVALLGTEKGSDTESRLKHNFGMARPEGYRKAVRVMELSDNFGLPVVSLVDTAGAYPGIGAEERHIAEAIAVNLREMMLLEVPIIATVIGEGGSGGALGIGVADRVLILENAYYSVISPEGCAAILWKDRSAAAKAAEALKITAKHLFELGLVDEVVPEPLGGAHTDPDGTSVLLKQTLLKHLELLQTMSPEQRLKQRYAKFRNFGQVLEKPVVQPEKSEPAVGVEI